MSSQSSVLQSQPHAAAGITVNVFDGARQPFSGEQILVTLRDGDQHERSRDYYKASTVRLTDLVPFNNARDNYTVLAAAEGYDDAGVHPVPIHAGQTSIVDLLLLPHKSAFNFHRATWTALPEDFLSLFAAGSATPEAASTGYSELMERSGGTSLACLLNLVTAMKSALLPQGTVLHYVSELSWQASGATAIAQDRIFCWVDPALIDQLELARQQHTFATAPFLLHPTATRSYKQLQFGEANLQLTFHERDRKEVDGRNHVLLETDIDYYKDPASHLLLEVAVNTLGSLTDPRHVYSLRWTAGRRAGIPEFDPLYTIEKA